MWRLAYERFRERITEKRLARGWTQDELADRAGIKRQTVTAWEGSRPIGYPISPDQLDGIARAFGDDPIEWLFALGYKFDCAGVDDELQAAQRRLFRAIPRPYQLATIEGLQRLARELGLEPE